MLRFLPFLVVAAVIVGLFNYLPLKREIVYKLGISGDTTKSCCETDTLTKSGEFDEYAKEAFYNGESIEYPKTSLAAAIKNTTISDTRVLGTTNAAGEEKWIDVSLAEQKVRAYEGATIVKEFLISSGRWAPTPTGDFRIWYKTRAQLMKGGSKALGTYYYLPNVPNNMFFYKGYALHGAYWHNNFGHPMSHGCVNEPLAEATWMFDWAGPVLSPGTNVLRASVDNPGTRVHIH